MEAMIGGHERAAWALICARADPSLQDQRGLTALMEGQKPMQKALLLCKPMATGSPPLKPVASYHGDICDAHNGLPSSICTCGRHAHSASEPGR